MGYAEQTFVPIERTKAEIETLLVKSGCDAIATLWDKRERRVAIQFRAHNRMVRFSLTLPSPDDPQYQYTPAKSVRRSQAAAEKAHDQAVRAKWRRLLLCIRAKLEAVDNEIESFEEAFLAQLLLPDGSTVAERALPAISQMYETGTLPPAGLLSSPRAS